MLVELSRKISISYFLTQKVYSEVRVPSLPVRPLSLEVFPSKAMSFWWEHDAVFTACEITSLLKHITLKKHSGKNPSQQLWCFLVSVFWNENVHIFSLKTSADHMEHALKAEGKKKTNIFSPFKSCLYSWKTLLLAGWTQIWESFLILPKICKSAFQTTRELV